MIEMFLIFLDPLDTNQSIDFRFPKMRSQSSIRAWKQTQINIIWLSRLHCCSSCRISRQFNKKRKFWVLYKQKLFFCLFGIISIKRLNHQENFIFTLNKCFHCLLIDFGIFYGFFLLLMMDIPNEFAQVYEFFFVLFVVCSINFAN